MFSTGSSLSQRDMGFFSQGLTGVLRQADETFSTPSTHSGRWTAVLYVKRFLILIVKSQSHELLTRLPWLYSLGTDPVENTALTLLPRNRRERKHLHFCVSPLLRVQPLPRQRVYSSGLLLFRCINSFIFHRQYLFITFPIFILIPFIFNDYNRVFQKELYKFERVYKFIQRTYTTFWTVIM
jgi:hypothetical protein